MEVETHGGLGRGRSLTMLLTENNIKSELSYAYLHAVAARAGVECHGTGRHSDGAGVDAFLRAKGKFHDDSKLTQFTVDVQLKATSTTPREPSKKEAHYAFDMEVPHYKKARYATGSRNNELLVIVLFLPNDPTEWLHHTVDGLLAKRCAYWVSLCDAPETTNSDKGSQVIYLPKKNVLSVDGLRDVLGRISRQERLTYESP